MNSLFKRMKAATGLEYGLIIGLIAVGLLTSLSNTGLNIATIFSSTENLIEEATYDPFSIPSGQSSGEGATTGTGAQLSGPAQFTLHQTQSPAQCGTISITNIAATSALNVNLSSLSGDYALCSAPTCSGTLATNETCDISIRGIATEAKNLTGILTVTSDNGGTVTTALSGAASAPLDDVLQPVGAATLTVNQSGYPGACTELQFQNVSGSAITLDGSPVYTGRYGNISCAATTCVGTLSAGQTCSAYIQGIVNYDTQINGYVILNAANGDNATYQLSGQASNTDGARLVASALKIANQTSANGPCTSIAVRNDGAGTATNMPLPYIGGDYAYCVPSATKKCGTGAQNLVSGSTCYFGVKGTSTTNKTLSGYALISAGNASQIQVNLSGTASGFAE